MCHAQQLKLKCLTQADVLKELSEIGADSMKSTGYIQPEKASANGSGNGFNDTGNECTYRKFTAGVCCGEFAYAQCKRQSWLVLEKVTVGYACWQKSYATQVAECGATCVSVVQAYGKHIFASYLLFWTVK